MINRISRKALEKKIRQLQHMGVPYDMEYTNERTIIHAEQGWGSWMNKESTFKASELHFIKGVKASIIRDKTYQTVRNNFKKKGSEGRIKYFAYNKNLLPGDKFEDVVEIDIKNAYWRTVFKLGLIDEGLYQKGLTVSKKSRLAAVGSLAKSKGKIRFDGREEEELPRERSEKTEFLWPTISYKIGKIMAEAAKACGEDFLFFWVDALFVKAAAVPKVIAILKKADYEWSRHDCEWAEFGNSKITVKCTEPADKKNKHGFYGKAKWIDRVVQTKYQKEGKTFIKKTKIREFKDTRPFPYRSALTETDFLELSSNQ